MVKLTSYNCLILLALIPLGALAKDPDRSKCEALFASRPTTVNELSRVMIDALRKNSRDFADSFARTSGLGSYETFVESLERSSNPDVRRLLKAILNEDFEIVMHRKSEGRNASVNVGYVFSNFQTDRRSSGDMGRDGETVEDAINRRFANEASYFGMDTADYKHVQTSERPKSAAVRLQERDWDHSVSRVLENFYGDDVWVFKKDRIRGRTLFIMGDSLDRLRMNSESVRRGYLGFTRKFWDQFAIPWEFLPVIALEALPAFKSIGELAIQSKAPVYEYQEWFQKNGLAEFLDYRRSTYAHPFVKEKGTDTGGAEVYGNGARYLEALILGRTTFADVSDFEFRTVPPEGQFLEALEQHQIRIWDRRDGGRKRWKAKRPGR